MPLRGMRPKTQKSPPILSHEFVIQNHADIVSCGAMLFVLGLVFQATSPMAQLFVTLGHNVTKNATDVLADGAPTTTTLYANGIKDVCAVFFYMLVAIVMHAVLQEYVLDKINRRLHLSKLKHSKFNESGQLLVFYAISLVWAVDILATERWTLDMMSSLWTGYPQEHALMPFVFKFYFIVQIAYWLHCYPELYFQKVKKDELSPRALYATFYLAFTVVGYALNFGRVTLVCLSCQHLVEAIRHAARLALFAEKPGVASITFMCYNVVFVLARLVTITLGILTFWYGLPLAASSGSLDAAAGNFNVQIIRINCISAICLMQAKLMWTFITFHLRRRRELADESAGSKKSSKSSKSTTSSSNGNAASSPRHGKKKAKGDYDDLPEADQQMKHKKTK